MNEFQFEYEVKPAFNLLIFNYVAFLERKGIKLYTINDKLEKLLFLKRINLQKYDTLHKSLLNGQIVYILVHDYFYLNLPTRKDVKNLIDVLKVMYKGYKFRFCYHSTENIFTVKTEENFLELIK